MITPSTIVVSANGLSAPPVTARLLRLRCILLWRTPLPVLVSPILLRKGLALLALGLAVLSVPWARVALALWLVCGVLRLAVLPISQAGLRLVMETSII